MNKTLKRILRLSIIATVILAAIWGVYFLEHGSIPSTNEVVSLNPDHAGETWFVLPMYVSRLFDFLISPIWIGAMVLLVENLAKREEILLEFIELFVILALLIGSLAGYTFGIATGLATTIVLVPIAAFLVVAIGIAARAIKWAILG